MFARITARAAEFPGIFGDPIPKTEPDQNSI